MLSAKTGDFGNSRLAQSVERTALNRVVGGSSPPIFAGKSHFILSREDLLFYSSDTTTQSRELS
ncbi:hypothetical protein PROFUN_10705 [Planoprotostelium fungivorum]|uniref:Uncharacterized protein n=1 Tax=Planoprotostelium fungivorum TaxID=1890364 RepID=A0A2P6N9P2_9EUKA|nr:hypothetical protein PROFUN_10705 [Planoprotostelium fungivorum]